MIGFQKANECLPTFIEPFQTPLFGEPVPPTRYRPDIPVWFENTLMKAIQRNPDLRYETAEEFVLALETGAAKPLAAHMANQT